MKRCLDPGWEAIQLQIEEQVHHMKSPDLKSVFVPEDEATELLRMELRHRLKHESGELGGYPVPLIDWLIIYPSV